jgi:integrase/recombinase XerD
LNNINLNDPLFKSQKGFHFSANSMRILIRNIFKKGGSEFDGCSSHSGRRTLITKVVNSGVSLNKVKEIAGHSSISTTLEYVDTNPNDLSVIMRNI